MSDARPVDARSMLARLASEWQVPLYAAFEISDRCNEVCVHCYQQQGQKGELSTAQVCAVLDQLAELGVLVVTLSGGEATLRSDFLQIVEHARHKGFAVRLFTNGLTMTRELAQELARLAVQTVEISVYSTRPEMHDFVTGVRGSFERSTAGVRHLAEAGVLVTMKTPLLSVNEDETEAYAALARSLGAEFSLSPTEILAREGEDRSTEAFEASHAGRVRLRRQYEPTPECAVTPVRPLGKAPCGAGESIHVEPNGELRPCTMLELDLGHALRDGVSTSRAANPHLRALRELTWSHLHGCRECDLRAFCNHCYAAALNQRGDALGPYPGACRGAAMRYEAHTGRPARIVANDAATVQCGPYRAVGDDRFEQLADRVSSDDDAIAARLGWTRRSGVRSPAPEVAARPGELVQIRRPGRKKSSLERIPPTGGAWEGRK